MIKFIGIRRYIRFATIFAIVACNKVDKSVLSESIVSSDIVAYVEQTPITRACITSELEGLTQVPVLWCPDDELGVFTQSESNIKYTNTSLKTNSEVATFKSSGTVTSEPICAYYPYSASSGSNAKSLLGNVPAVQDMNITTGHIPGDYKIGEYAQTTSNGVQFRFTHLFSPIRIRIDGVGTALEDDRLLGIDLTVSRGGTGVPICGDFTFNAQDGTYNLGSSTFNTVTFDWTSKSILNSSVTAYATLFPEIKSGDNLTFTIRTSARTATINVTAKVDFAPNTVYTFPLTLSKYANQMNVVQRPAEDISGSFKCATYNIKGSSNGTIGTYITQDQWDVLMFCECSGGYTQNMNGYSFATKSSTLGDLLYFATRTEKCTFSNEYKQEYDAEYGGLFDGANTTVAKGFRYYLVTLNDGVKVDVYITHMNTYSDTDTGHINAQHAQLEEVATYIKKNRNGRPVIFMGDTNCRYTRHDFKTYFWDIIQTDGITISDPWVDCYWNGVYPEYGSKYSLVVEDADGTNPAIDLIYSSQQGEVVDKVIYINDANADVQISAMNYLRDTDYMGLSDHLPVVVDFYYEKRAASKAAGSAVGVDSWDEELDVL